MIRPSACPCCASIETTPLFEVAGQAYIRCSACGSARLDPLPRLDPTAHYGPEYFTGGSRGGYVDYDADADLHLRNAAARLDRLVKHLPVKERRRLVDVGCASGYLLDEARRRGWEVKGVEVSGFARERAHARGHEVHSTLDEGLRGAPADAVTFYQVLEHMADPLGAVATAAQHLVDGGIVAIETWDLSSWVARAFGRRWQQANPPTVLHLFTRKGLRSLLERVGLKLEALGSTAKYVSVGFVSHIAAHRWGRAGRLVERFARTTRLANVSLRYGLDDLVTVMGLNANQEPERRGHTSPG